MWRRGSSARAPWVLLITEFDSSSAHEVGIARKLESMTREIGLGDAIAAGSDILAGKIQGRVVVNVNA